MNKVMIDIETLGTKAYSSILSISAVVFNEQGKTGEEFDVNITLQSCMDEGLKVDPDTLLWWMKQTPEARAIFTDDRERFHIREALAKLYNWWRVNVPVDAEIYAKDPIFDVNMIEDAYESLGIPSDFNFRNTRSVRTISALIPYCEQNATFTGVIHNGIDDCKHQIKYVTEVLRLIRPTISEIELNF